MKEQSKVLDFDVDQTPPAKGRTPRSCSCLLLLLVAVPAMLCAQASQMTFERLSQAQGLYGNEVHCILQDSRGYMWFGTEKGLNRYDGTNFTVYRHEAGNPSSIVDAKVQSIWEDRQGTLWVGTWNGLEKFDRATGTFSHFLPEPKASPGDWSNVIYDVFEDRSGTLWVGGKGAKSFDRLTGKFTFYPHSDTSLSSHIRENVDAIFEDSRGDLWLGTAGALERLDRSSQSYSQYWVDEVLKKGPYADFWGFHWIQKIYEDRSGLLWLCTNRGPVAFNRETGVFKPYEIYRAEPESTSARSIASILEDDSGILWIGTWGGGYLTYNARADSFESHSLSLYSSNNSVCTLYKDRVGIIWMGTNGDGVLKVTRQENRFTGFVHNPSDFGKALGRIPPVTSSIQHNDVWFIYQGDSGSVSLGTKTGGDRFFHEKRYFEHGATWDWPYSLTGFLRSRFAPVTYTGVDDGFNEVYDSPYRRTFYSTPDSSLGASACSFFEDRRGILWMLISGAGVCQFDPRTKRFKRLGIGNVQPFVAARMFVEDSIDATPNGWTLWIGANDGLWLYDARVDAFTRFSHNGRDLQSLSSDIVTTIFRDATGTLWIGTDHGLDRMNSTSVGTFEHLAVGEEGDAVQGIQEDRNGHLWVSTTRAIARFDPGNGRLTSYSMKGVLPDIKFGAGCCLYSDRQEMYFGGSGGIVVFNPDSISPNPYVPPIVLTGFNVFDAPASLDSVIEGKTYLELSYKDDVFSVEFAALNFLHPENNQYAYILEGHDTSWTYCGDRQMARYMKLEPGRYTFRVKGCNNDGLWNEEGRSLAIVITPPWWKTPLFSVLVWVAAAGSLGGTVRYVERRRLKKRIAELEAERALERERARISQDMHDEVGSSLSEIAILSELAKRKPEEARDHVEEISDRTAELIDSVGEIVWAMNPKNDTLDNLASHVRRYAVKYLNLAGIACSFVAPDSIPAAPLAAEARRNLFLVVKEALHNIVKHSAASAVTITLTLEHRGMQILIEDNGKGFVLEAGNDAGNGLGNMKKRMQDAGFMFKLQSEPGRGTKVTIDVTL